MRAHVAMLLLLGCGGSPDPLDAPRPANRLIHESSPYLLQHAHNPVDWRPWGDAALAEAKALDRPVFLSIGYSTCHWCHVMAEESFEDAEIAALLNSRYVPIKVDRDERPDVDAVYLRAVQVLTGRGGWPMTLVLTPEGVPLYAGTYLPPRAGDRGAVKGLAELLVELSDRWSSDRELMVAHARDVSERMEHLARPPVPRDLPGPDVLDATRSRFEATWDPRFGGFGKEPRFPEPLELRWLFTESRRTGDPKAQEMALHTLDAILAGGVRDHLGGGFHRYAVDAAWSVPHFEKMLYDQALMASALTEAWQVTGDPRYAAAARDTLDYLLREHRDGDGAFRAAFDADSPGPDGARSEGRFYTWTPAELRDALGERAELAIAWYGVTESGAIEGRSVLTQRRAAADVAKELGRDETALAADLLAVRRDLLAARRQRPAPFRDDTIVLGWNALATSAFARAGLAFDEPIYLEAARGAARHLNRQMVLPSGDFAHSQAGGRLGSPAVLEDQAQHTLAMLDLFESTGELDWLQLAIRSAEQLDERFGDPAGGWWETAHGGPALLVRGKPWSDVSTPSGNGAATLACLRLYALTGETRWRERADLALALFANNLDKQGSTAPTLLQALDLRLAWVHQVVLVPGIGREAMWQVLRTTHPSGRVQAPVFEPGDPRLEVFSLLAGKVARDGAATAYVCHDGVCEAPTTDPAVLATALAQKR